MLDCLSMADYFQPTLKFPAKARAYPSEEPFMLHSFISSCPYLQTLDLPGNAFEGTNTLAFYKHS